MAASLTASFVLKLEDRLSSGIVGLTKKLEALSALAAKLKFDGLQQAGGAFDKMGAAAETASRKVEGIGRSARSAVTELKRLSSQPIMINTGGTAFLPPSVTRAAMAATIAAAAAAGGAGGYRAPALPSASFFSTPHLQLGGPGGGGIPLQFNPALMQMSSPVGLAGQFKTQMGQAAAHAGSLNHHLREAGHGALGALTTGFGLFEPVREYAAYENVARHIAITENVPREQLPATIKQLTKGFDKLALSTGQSAEKVAESANFLITTGIGGAAVDKMLPIIAKAATAYNTDIGDSVQAVFALKENLHVRDEDLGTAVSSGALAAKQGHFSFQDMSHYLPAIAPIAAMSGLKGLGGAQELMASLETSRRNSGTSEEAFTNYRDYLSHLFGDPKRGLAHGFAKGYGIDLEKVLLTAEKQGISAPEAVVAQVKALVEGKTAYETNLIIGSLFHNQQSASYLRGRLADDKYFNTTNDKLHETDPNTIQNDFLKAFDAPQVQLNRLQRALKQLVRRFGEGFAGLVPPITAGLESVLAFLDRVDERFPGLVNKVLGFTGGFLALTAVFGILLPVFRAVGSGFMLLGTTAKLAVQFIAWLSRAFVALQIAGGPVLWIIEAIALVAFLIYENWDKIGPYFWALVEKIKQAWAGLKEWFAQLWAGILSRFDDLIQGIERRIAAIKQFLGLGGGATGRRDKDASDTGPSSAPPNPADQRLQDGNGAPIPYAPISYRPGAGGRFSYPPLDINIKWDGPGRVDAPRQLQPVDRGPMPMRA